MTYLHSVLQFVEQHQQAIAFVSLLSINVATKILKAWQEYQWQKQELRQDEEVHQKQLKQ